MNKDKKDNQKQLVLRLDQDLYNILSDRAKVKDITITAEIRNLLLSGISYETKNKDMFYLIKILNILKLNYDLTVQEFCNKGYASNRDPKKDIAYNDFLNNRKKDIINE